MRVAVIYFQKDRSSFEKLAKGLAKGLEEQNNQVTIINGNLEVVSLTTYKYIAIGIESESALSLKMPDKLTNFISNSGMVSGKRTYAFTNKALRSEKRLSVLMKHIEKEGMILKRSDIISSENGAKEIGKKLKVESH